MTTYNIDDYSIFKYDKSKYAEYTNHELALFNQDALGVLDEIAQLVGKSYFYNKPGDDLVDNVKALCNREYESDRIMKDWKEFTKHLEENPSLKEEWEALMMAIKLTEDFD